MESNKLKVCIIGLGLIGGSLAKALSFTKKYTVCAYDIDESVCSAALLDGCVSEIVDLDEFSADIVVLALSPRATVNFVKEHINNFSGSIVTDVCGIKGEIVKNLELLCLENGAYFVGGHPMAGRERNGFENSVQNLFENRYYILTKTENTNEHALKTLECMAYDIGCLGVTVTTPEHHDKMIAYTSQMPHILAGTYMKSPSSSDHNGFSAGSYHDVSRVASVDENLWSQLFLLNRDSLLAELDIFIKNIAEYKKAITDNDRERLAELIKEGRLLKERDLKQNGAEKPHNFG